MSSVLQPSVSHLVRTVGRYLLDCFRIDTRSLATFRMLVGGLIVADVFLRARNFSFYYTDRGIVPQSLAREQAPDLAVSVYFLTTDTAAIAGLMALQVLVALLLIVGYRTRFAAVVSFIFVVSLDHHNPFVLSYADTLFRLLLFWGIFLPLGERWSVDGVLADGHPRKSVLSVVTPLALGQMVVMYLVNGIHKLESSLWRSGEATPLIFGIDEMTFLLGDTMRQFPTLLEYGGLLWFYMLLASPLLILLRGRVRTAFVGLFFGGHLAFALTVRIGAFAYVAMAGLLLFLQASFWNDASRLLSVARGDIQTRAGGLTAYASRFPAFRVVPADYAWLRPLVYHTAVAAVVLALGFIGIILVANAGVVFDGGYDQHALNGEVASNSGGEYVYGVAAGLGVVQPEWSVFAPHPRTTDRYYVFGATTVDGERYDVYNDRPFTWDRPYDELQKQHDTYRHRFFMNSIRRSSSDDELPANLGEHICRSYQEERGIELSHISMFEITEDISRETIDDPAGREVDRDHFYRHDCGESATHR